MRHLPSNHPENTIALPPKLGKRAIIILRIRICPYPRTKD
jgi:hypothetical protein